MAKDEAPDPRSQAEKFADLARELECDESEEAFDERLRAVARQRSDPDAPKADGEAGQ